MQPHPLVSPALVVLLLVVVSAPAAAQPPAPEPAPAGGAAADPVAAATASPPERTVVDVPIVETGPVAGADPDLSLASRAAALLGAVLDPDAPTLPLGGGGADLQQSLGRALFAAPVAGSIPYVVGTQIHHHTTIAFPPAWRVVDVLVGDQLRWAVHRAGSLVVVQPGEPGARTNLTVVLDTGEVVQMDLHEITGLYGTRRVGRVYVGPEPWLVDRIFGMLPPTVRDRVAASPATVAQLLADPLVVVGLYGGTGAVPNPVRTPPSDPGSPEPAAPPPGALAPLPEPSPVAPGDTEPPAAAVPGAPQGPVYVPAAEVGAQDNRLAAALDEVATARRDVGDRIAAAQLGLETQLEGLREDYPLRMQFSYTLDPDVPPYTEPFWHFGVWHDGEHTLWRLLAPDPVFMDAETDTEVSAEALGDFVYRLDRVVDRGVVLVPQRDGSVLERLFFRRRRELESP